MSQYFENDDMVKTSSILVKYTIFEKTFTLKSNNGVFSKNRIDDGTYAFLKVLIPLRLGSRILDLGCGYGAIGLTLASFRNDYSIVLADINTRALELARENANCLSLIKQVTILQSDIYQNIEGKFDSIVINPPIRAGKRVIYSMFSGAKEYLIDGGSLFIVIRKSHGAKSASSYLLKEYDNVQLLKRDKGYYIYKSTKEVNKK